MPLNLENRIESLYKLFRQMVLDEKDPENQLLQLQALIDFCWKVYPLRFSDAALDELVWSLSLPVIPEFIPKEHHQIYIASTLMEVGGHTRWLLNLIEHQPSKAHVVVLTKQRKPLPENVQKFFKEQNVQVINLKSDVSLLNSARELQDLIKEILPGRIFLFNHPDDIIPVLSLAHSKHIQTYLFNHSDHVFSVGARFFSRSVEFRSIGARISQQAKGIRHVGLHVLPVKKRSITITKKEAKQLLKLPDSGYVVGALTNPTKALPYQNKIGIVEWMVGLANQHPTHFFLIIGLEHHHLVSWKGSQQIPSNIRAVGIQSLPDMYYRSMDFFLEPFPIGSGLGIIEAAHHGAFPIFTPHDAEFCATYSMFDPDIQILFESVDSLDESTNILNSYLGENEQVISEKAQQLEDMVEQKHRGDQWLKGLEMALSQDVDAVQIDEEKVVQEARFFQLYLHKSFTELLTYILNSSYLSTPRHLSKLFRYHRYLFTRKTLTRQNIKRILLRLRIYPSNPF